MSLAALPLYDSEIEAQLGKTRKSKRQRRQEKFQFGVAHSGSHCPNHYCLCVFGQTQKMFVYAYPLGSVTCLALHLVEWEPFSGC